MYMTQDSVATERVTLLHGIAARACRLRPSVPLHPAGHRSVRDSAPAVPPERLAGVGPPWPGVGPPWPGAGLPSPVAESRRRPPAVWAAVPLTTWPSVTNGPRPPDRYLPSG